MIDTSTVEGYALGLDARGFNAEAATLRALAQERDAAKEEAADARSTLSAWFDLSKKAEDAGANVLRDSLNTWLRRAVNGGMSVERANIVRNVVDEAARLYLWDALVPVLRTMCDTLNTENAARAEREACAAACEAVHWMHDDDPMDRERLGDHSEDAYYNAKQDCAAAIRARAGKRRGCAPGSACQMANERQSTANLKPEQVAVLRQFNDLVWEAAMVELRQLRAAVNYCRPHMRTLGKEQALDAILTEDPRNGR